MPRHLHLLPGLVADFAADTVGIADGNVEEVPLPRRLVVGNRAFHHVSQVIELVAQVLDFLPTLRPGPFVRVLRVHRPGGIEVAVRFLRGRYDSQHAVDVRLQLLVGISLEDVARTLDGFIDVGIVERISPDRDGVAGMRGLDKVLVPPCLLAFAKGQGNGYFPARLQALPPEGVRSYFDRCERHRVYRIAVVLLRAGRKGQDGGERQ